MAEEEQNVISAAFPAPPPFYKHFTEANLARMKELKTEVGSDDDILKQRLLELPTELRYLLPPEPPASGLYRSFGGNYNIREALPTLADQGLEQVYPSYPPSSSQQTESEWTFDRAQYLRRITKSIFLNFIELVGILSVDPGAWTTKYDQLQTLFINAHHLVNEYRPHQARETLIMAMEMDLARRRKEVEGVREMGKKVAEVLGQLGGDGAEDELHGNVDSFDTRVKEREKVEQRAVWAALDDPSLFEDIA